jgi:hypothetical protein
MTHLQPQEQGRGSSLLESAFWESCRQLKQVVEGENSSASFVCGGVITIATTGLGKEKLAKKTSPPVKIFWASPGKSHARKVVLPLKESADSNLQILQQLVKDCAPVTTKCDLDKIDPNYLKVGEMDSDNFATSFDLAKFGILEFVERILYPAIEESHKINFQSRKLSAELCKLNVGNNYSLLHIYLLTDTYRRIQGGPASPVERLARHVPPTRSVHWWFACHLNLVEAI